MEPKILQKHSHQCAERLREKRKHPFQVPPHIPGRGVFYWSRGRLNWREKKRPVYDPSDWTSSSSAVAVPPLRYTKDGQPSLSSSSKFTPNGVDVKNEASDHIIDESIACENPSDRLQRTHKGCEESRHLVCTSGVNSRPFSVRKQACFSRLQTTIFFSYRRTFDVSPVKKFQ